MRPDGSPRSSPARPGSGSAGAGGSRRSGNAGGGSAGSGGSGGAGSGSGGGKGSGDGERRRVSPFGRVIRHLEGRLGAGLLVFVPILVTYFVFSLFYDFISTLLDPLARWLNIPDFPGRLDLTNVVEIVVLLIVVYIAGQLINWAATKFLINIVHDLIGKLPVLGAVYRTTRQGIDFLSDTQEQSYRGVVLIEFPRLGVYSIGLITSSLGLLDGVEEYLSIYVPTTPVPSSGYLVVVPASKVMPTDISVDEAMRIIISGGILAGDIFAERGGSVRRDPQWPGRHSL